MANSAYWPALVNWLQIDPSVITHESAAAGRYLCATTDIAPSTVLFTIPARFLLNSRSLGSHYPNSAQLSAVQLMSLHLCLYKPLGGAPSRDSLFGPYIDSLPTEFNHHPWEPTNEPPSVVMAMQELRARYDEDLAAVRTYLQNNLQERTSALNADFFKWAWLNVNTRGIYHRLKKTRSDPDNLTMCPILDFANHQPQGPTMSLRTTQAEKTNTAPIGRLGDPITVLSPPIHVKAGDELFLTYGAHPNSKLYVEYGFCMHHECPEVDVQDLVEPMFVDDAKRGVLVDSGYWGDWKLDASPAVSYRLVVALSALVASQEEMPLWKDMITGEREMVSTANEAAWKRIVQVICRKVIERAEAALSSAGADRRVGILWRDELGAAQECMRVVSLSGARRGADAEARVSRRHCSALTTNSVNMAVEPLLSTRTQRAFILTVTLQAIIVLTMVGITFRKVEVKVDFSSTSSYKTLPCYLALFAFAEIFELFMAFDALRLRNTIQLMGILLFHMALIVFAAIQVKETKDALVSKSAAECAAHFDMIRCGGSGSLYESVQPFLIVVPCIIAAAWLAMMFFVKELYSEFGWAIFHVVGANPKMKKMYQWYQILLCLLKFDFFFFVAVTMQLLIVVLVRNSAEFGVTIAAIPVVLVLLALAVLAVQREIKWLMSISLAMMLAALSYFREPPASLRNPRPSNDLSVFKLVRIYEPSTASQYSTTKASLTIFTIVAFLLLFATFAVGLRCFADFNRGLREAKVNEPTRPQYSQKNSGNVAQQGSYNGGAPLGQRISIE
uniref:SET domain-containing protein n=1 Tax=Mycena chlorophos TaxID=658473 RepID=A0ABQ0M5R2_MYCCL|nr:predicted protein [Mycena chlorophos]